MTRRELLFAATAVSPQAPSAVTVPVHLLYDLEAPHVDRFNGRIWPEAVGNLRKPGIQVTISRGTTCLIQPVHRDPIIPNLERGKLNILVTRNVPMHWDRGRMLNGATLLYRGFHLCVIAMNWAHGHQFPFLSVNTCLHEMLHALLGDIFERRPAGFLGEARELRVDACATRLWLWSDAAVLSDARRYLARLSASACRECS